MYRVASLPILCLLAGLLVGCTASPGEEDRPFAPAPDAELLGMMEGLHAAPELSFRTDHGEIRLLLYTDLMPETTAHIGSLAREGFYDDTLIHRVVDDFVIQGGDPSGTGQEGSGQSVPFERYADLLFGAGAVGLARGTDPDSGDSQWFITETPAPHLSDSGRSTVGSLFGDFALFAQVIGGMDVVREIAAVPVIPGLDRPIEDVHVQEATLLPPPGDIDLLRLPPTLRLQDDAPGWILQRPLFLVSGHPFPVMLFYEAPEGEAPPATVTLTYRMADAADDAEVLSTLEPHPDDAQVYTGTVTLDAAGPWQEVVSLGGGMAEVAVLPWHDDYVRYLPEDGPD